MATKKQTKKVGKKIRGTAPSSRLTKMLRAKGMTRAQFGRKMGVTLSRVTTWTRDGIPQSLLSEAARILDVEESRIPCAWEKRGVERAQPASQPASQPMSREEAAQKFLDKSLPVMERLRLCEEQYAGAIAAYNKAREELNRQYAVNRGELVAELAQEIERMKQAVAQYTVASVEPVAEPVSNTNTVPNTEVSK